MEIWLCSKKFANSVTDWGDSLPIALWLILFHNFFLHFHLTKFGIFFPYNRFMKFLIFFPWSCEKSLKFFSQLAAKVHNYLHNQYSLFVSKILLKKFSIFFCNHLMIFAIFSNSWLTKFVIFFNTNFSFFFCDWFSSLWDFKKHVNGLMGLFLKFILFGFCYMFEEDLS